MFEWIWEREREGCGCVSNGDRGGKCGVLTGRQISNLDKKDKEEW